MYLARRSLSHWRHPSTSTMDLRLRGSLDQICPNLSLHTLGHHRLISSATLNLPLLPHRGRFPCTQCHQLHMGQEPQSLNPALWECLRTPWECLRAPWECLHAPWVYLRPLTLIPSASHHNHHQHMVPPTSSNTTCPLPVLPILLTLPMQHMVQCNSPQGFPLPRGRF